MDKKQIDSILKKHVLFLESEGNHGALADFRNLNLNGINLPGTNLRNAQMQKVSLINAKLKWTDLEEADLKNSILNGADFEKANFKMAYLENSQMKGVNLKEANLKRADLRKAILKKANLIEAKLQHADMFSANLESAVLQETSLYRAKLQDGILIDADLENAYLEYTGLQGAKINRANLQGAIMEGAILQNADLRDANMQTAIMEATNLENANLENTNLQRVNLKGANLKGANFSGANLFGSNLTSIKIDDFTNFQNATLDFCKINFELFESFFEPYEYSYSESLGLILPSEILNKNRIKKTIEFPSEHRQAGQQILSYFSTVLETKYPNMEVKVTIEQKGTTVKMIIDHGDGDPDVIKKEMTEYAMVVAGKKTPEQYFPDNPFAAMQLQSQLDIKDVTLKSQERLIAHQTQMLNNQTRIIESLSDVAVLNKDLIPNFNKMFEKGFLSNNTLKFSPNTEINAKVSQEQYSTMEITPPQKNDISQFIGLFEARIKELENQGLESIAMESVDILKKEMNIPEPDQSKVAGCLKTIKNVLDGAMGSIVATDLLPRVSTLLSDLGDKAW